MRIFLLLCLSVLGGTIWAQYQEAIPTGFEGTLVYSLKYTPKGEANVKGLLPDSLRLQVGPTGILATFEGKDFPPEAREDILVDTRTGLVQLISHPIKTIYFLPKRKEGEESKTSKTGESATVLGLKSKKYIIRTPSAKTTQTIWVGDSLWVAVPTAVRLQTGLPVVQDSSKLDLCLKMVNQNPHGTQTLTLRRIVPETLSESLFLPPESYEQKTFDENQPRLKILK